MPQYEFNTTIENGKITVPAEILYSVSANVKVILQTKNIKHNIDDISRASEHSLAID